MRPTRASGLWLALSVVAGMAAAEEPAPAPARTEAPAAAPTPAAPARFESTLSHYRPYRADEPLADWRAANAAVGQAGGHMGHQQAAPAESPRPHGDHGE